MRIRVSIEGQLALLAVCLVAASLALALVFHRLTGDWATTFVLALAVAVPLAIWVARRWAGPVGRLLRALNDGFTSLRDGDFSVSLASNRRDELGELVSNYNAVGDVLRRERQDLFQRELLLDTVIQSTRAGAHRCYGFTRTPSRADVPWARPKGTSPRRSERRPHRCRTQSGRPRHVV
jgi:HAMP domain-containing protein